MESNTSPNSDIATVPEARNIWVMFDSSTQGHMSLTLSVLVHFSGNLNPTILEGSEGRGSG